MKRIARVGGIAVLAATFATAGEACPWSGGTFFGKYLSFRIDIEVNKGCTEAVIKSSGSAGFQEPDTPETFALARSKDGWVADVHGAKTVLQEDGKYIWIDGPALRKRLLARRGG